MKTNVSRLIGFCAVILGFMLVGYDISFAQTQSSNLEPAHFVPAVEKPINIAVTLKEQKQSAWESGFEWVFLSAFMVLGSLLLVWVLAFSAASKLPTSPQARAANVQKQAALYDKGRHNEVLASNAFMKES